MAWEPNSLEQQRLGKIDRLRQAGIDPFPRRIERTHKLHEAIAAYENDPENEGIEVTVCGRLVSARDMGKTVFAHLADEDGRLQLFVRREAIGEESHRVFRKLLDLGDWVQAAGVMFRTRAGEISLRVSSWKLLRSEEHTSELQSH